MKQSKQDIIDRFFELYRKHDRNEIKQVMSENITWYFMGRHPMAGVKKGIDEVIDFYDQVGKIMSTSKPTIEKLIVEQNDDYLVECIHSNTNRTDDNNLDHYACVLWKFENGKITEGRHFFSDPQAVDKYFTALADKQVAAIE
jgi:ketosteroid isomerase-like protein